MTTLYKPLLMNVNIHYKNNNFTNFDGNETENHFVLLKEMYRDADNP